MLRDFRLPAGMTAEDVDANGDGEVLVVLELAVDQELIEAGVAREVVNRWGRGRGDMCLPACLPDPDPGLASTLLSNICPPQKTGLTTSTLWAPPPCSRSFHPMCSSTPRFQKLPPYVPPPPQVPEAAQEGWPDCV